MKRKIMLAIAIVAAGLLVLGGAAISGQDKYTAKVPGGLAFSEFRGYEGWQFIAISYNDHAVAVIVGNPAMIQAYESGIPANGKPFPDGAKMAKIHWSARKSPDAPAPTTIPGALHDVDFMVKDSKRFADTAGWGYAQFLYVPASNSFTPDGTGAACGAACHTLARAKDMVFTEYGRR